MDFLKKLLGWVFITWWGICGLIVVVGVIICIVTYGENKYDSSSQYRVVETTRRAGGLGSTSVYNATGEELNNKERDTKKYLILGFGSVIGVLIYSAMKNK